LFLNFERIKTFYNGESSLIKMTELKASEEIAMFRSEPMEYVQFMFPREAGFVL
jgi:hypothetical protein